MKSSSKRYSLLYYGAVAAASLMLILLIFNGLNWPVSAEIILGSTLLIHSMALAKTAKQMFLAAYKKGLIHEFVYRLQHGYDISESKSDSDA
ncbi:MAG: hypothetical protein R6V27_14010 [Balneolaceae bacterium]